MERKVANEPMTNEEKAFKYANLLAKAINENDVTKFRESIAKFCFPAVAVTKNVSTNVPGTGTVPIHSSIIKQVNTSNITLVCTKYNGIDQFCQLFADFFEIVPDGMMEVYDHRCYHQCENYTVFTSSYRYSGTILSAESRPNNHFSPTVDFPLVHLHLQGSSNPLNIIGTMATYVHSSGYVCCIEFFLEYL